MEDPDNKNPIRDLNRILLKSYRIILGFSTDPDEIPQKSFIFKQELGLSPWKVSMVAKLTL